MHISIEMTNGISPVLALLDALNIAYPNGLIWGYLYLRTLSIVPGTL